MRRILIATLASLALGLPLLAAPVAQAQTEDTTASATPAHAHHARRHRHRHHHSMRNHAGAEGMTQRPDVSGSAGTGTSSSDTTGAQTSLPSAIGNQAPGTSR
jgi:Ni/Co efflux regulator RcnB